MPTDQKVFYPLTNGFDSFESYYTGEGTPISIPWNYGEPKQWEIDDTRKVLGDKSIRNVKPVGVGAASTLSLDVNLPGWSLLRCQLYVDIAMPFDWFYITINGERRNAYYRPTGEWVSLTTGIAPGDTTIIFTVENNNIPIGANRNTASEGSGFVWIDICDIQPV